MNFTNEHFKIDDEYMTPKSAWENVQHLIPKNLTLWEAFYGDGTSGQYLRELGYQVIHERINFYDHNLGDVVVSNPPYSNWVPVIQRLVELEKPFVLIIPSSRLFTVKFQTLFGNTLDHLQVVIPRRRIQFVKNPPAKHNRCNFDCIYAFYKMNLEKDLTFLP